MCGCVGRGVPAATNRMRMRLPNTSETSGTDERSCVFHGFHVSSKEGLLNGATGRRKGNRQSVELKFTLNTTRIDPNSSLALLCRLLQFGIYPFTRYRAWALRFSMAMFEKESRNQVLRICKYFVPCVSTCLARLCDDHLWVSIQKR